MEETHIQTSAEIGRWSNSSQTERELSTVILHLLTILDTDSISKCQFIYLITINLQLGPSVIHYYLLS